MTTKKGIVENCLLTISDPFTLVVLAAYRSQELASGMTPCVATEGSKDALVSLKEISSGSLDMDSLKDRMIKSLQRFDFLSEKGINDPLPISKSSQYLDQSSLEAHALFQKSDAENAVNKNIPRTKVVEEELDEEELDDDFLDIASELDPDDQDDSDLDNHETIEIHN